METGEENCGNANLKRQREPLSDSDDNILSAPEVNDGQKRRRLEAAGQENWSPKPSSSGRLAELETKADTPMVPSVRSRVQLLTQRRDGVPVTQRCLSDPGADSPSVIAPDKGAREHLLGEGEFNQRLERFKAPLSQDSPTLMQSPTDSCPRTRSNFVSGIQQKLQCSTTPSSKQASRIRQEREEELNQLQFLPISENAWLKRTSSDSSLTQQVQGDAEMNDGSFLDAPTADAEKPSGNMTGERSSSASGPPAASAQLGSSREERDRIGHHGEEVGEENEQKASVVNEDKRPGSEQPESQAVLKLSFSEHQIVSQLPATDEQSVLKSTSVDESEVEEATEVSKLSEEDTCEVFTFDEDEILGNSSCGDEAEIEPSTDEELKMWRYPQGNVYKNEKSIVDKEQEVCTKEALESSKLDKEEGRTFTNHDKAVSAETAGSPEKQEDKKARAESEDVSVKEEPVSEGDRGTIESCDGCHESIPTESVEKQEQEVVGCTDGCDAFEQSKTGQAVSIKGVAETPKESQMETADHERNIEDVAELSGQAEGAPSDSDGHHGAQRLTAIKTSDSDGRQGVQDGQMHETQEKEGRKSSKKVTFVLEPELINSSTFSESDTSMESRAEMSLSDAGSSPHDETNTAELIEQMFDEVLEYAERVEEDKKRDEDAEDRDSGIGVCSGGKDQMDVEKDKCEDAKEEECDPNEKLESIGDELLTFPPSGILSPLSKSVEAVVTPMRLAAARVSNPPSLLLSPEETSTPPAESAPLYSIDAYRTQRQSKLPTIQSVTPAVQRRTPETPKPQPSVNTKEKIATLSEEAGKLQTVINQTLQALSCCTDEEHGRGSLEEAEAEKLLLVSCEKRSALLAEVARLREERSSESEEAAKEDTEYVSQQPCRGTVGITDIQLPLKVEFVCSSHNRTGRPSHYFFVLIRYGPCNIVATPLATAADARNGDAISFPTSVTLKDIRSSFEIDVEVYSLSHTSGTICSTDRTVATTKSRVTPRKLLNTLTRTSNSLTSAAPTALNPRRSSNFCLVGSHKITLTSLGHSKFPLDKMKFEGKIRRLLGDEFQEKVPFLSPLEGNIYLRLDSESHSNVQHQGFLTMFELVSGYGLWHRRYFVLEGCNMFYWNHPNDRETKEAEGSISLSRSPSQCVRPVKRDSCARPFTFELVSNIAQQQDQNQDTLSKCWFSADTKQERLDWMEKLNQALLDFHTWSRTHAESLQSNTSSSGSLRESIL